MTFSACVLAGVGIGAISRYGSVIVRGGATVSFVALLLFFDVRAPSLKFPVKPLQEPPIYTVLRRCSRPGA